MSTEPSSLMRSMEAVAGTVMGVEADPEQLDLLRDPETNKLPADIFQRMRSGAEKRGPGRPAGARNKKSDALGRLIVSKYGCPVEGMAALYAMPLDQLVELLLIADGSKDREDRLLTLAEQTEVLVNRMLDDGEAGQSLSKEQIDRLEQLIERTGDLAKSLKTKPGELALKALQTQLAARREVAPYVHGKMPVQVDVTTRADVILNIPGLTDPAHLAQYVDNAELTDLDLARLEFAPSGDEGGNDADA